MTEDRDQDEFVRGFLKELAAEGPLHKWRGVYVSSYNGEGEIVITAIGRGAIWFRLPAPFELPAVRSICREIQGTIDAARALHGD